MKINFRVNPVHIIFNSLTCEKIKYSNELEDFRNYLKTKYKKEYDFISEERVRNYFIHIFSKEDLIKSKMSNTIKIYDEIMKNPIFKSIVDDAIKYCNQLERFFNSSSDFLFKFMKDITNIELPNEEIDIYVINPNFYTGFASSKYFNIHNKNVISWGHHLSNEIPNYDLVYLFHEILHIVFNNKFLKIEEQLSQKELFYETETFHSLIELMADNELRVKLNQGKYFELKSHLHLAKWNELIYPYWIFHINRNAENILEEVKKMFERDEKEYDLESLYEIFKRFKFQNMNIIDFWIFVKTNIIKK